jgi:hypothetical protein
MEQFIKNVAFSLETTPSPSPMTNKRCKLNMNVVDTASRHVQL